MSGNCKPLPSGSRDPYLPYEPPSSREEAKHVRKKLPVAPQLGELKPESSIAGEVPPSRHVQKLLSGMWGLVQKVVKSAADQPIVTKQTLSPQQLVANQKLYVENCFSIFRENFKELYKNISTRSPS